MKKSSIMELFLSNSSKSKHKISSRFSLSGYLLFIRPLNWLIPSIKTSTIILPDGK